MTAFLSDLQTPINLITITLWVEYNYFVDVKTEERLSNLPWTSMPSIK